MHAARINLVLNSAESEAGLNAMTEGFRRYTATLRSMHGACERSNCQIELPRMRYTNRQWQTELR